MKKSWGIVDQKLTDAWLNDNYSICHVCGDNKNTFMYRDGESLRVGCCLCNTISAQSSTSPASALFYWVEFQYWKHIFG